MGRSLRSCWRSLWEHRLPSRLTRLPFLRREWKPLSPNRPIPERPRGGFAVKELLLVLSVLGFGVVGLKIVDPLSDEQRDTALVRRVELMSGNEVPLGDEFSCTVTLIKLFRPDSSRLPYYLSRVQFACRDAVRSDPFVIDILSDVVSSPSWVRTATCRTWALMNAADALDYLYEHGEVAIAPFKLTEEDRMSVLIDCLSGEAQEVTRLGEPLWRCVPAPLQETGIVVNTDGMALQDMHEIKGFPLSRLASAIQSAARRDDWTPDDPWALLTPISVGDLAVTAEEKHAVAQSLVYRLLDYLPQEASVAKRSLDK